MLRYQLSSSIFIRRSPWSTPPGQDLFGLLFCSAVYLSLVEVYFRKLTRKYLLFVSASCRPGSSSHVPTRAANSEPKALTCNPYLSGSSSLSYTSVISLVPKMQLQHLRNHTRQMLNNAIGTFLYLHAMRYGVGRYVRFDVLCDGLDLGRFFGCPHGCAELYISYQSLLRLAHQGASASY